MCDNIEELVNLYLQFYNKFEEILKSNSDACLVCPFKKQCSTYVNGRGSYICDDLEYLLEILGEIIWI